jgi:hypothetical protein
MTWHYKQLQCYRYTRNYRTTARTKPQSLGCAIAQAIRVRARIWSCGICGGQSGARAGFLRVLRFPLPIFIPPIAPQSPSSIIWGLYNRPEVAAVLSGLSPTPLKNKPQSFIDFPNHCLVTAQILQLLCSRRCPLANTTDN